MFQKGEKGYWTGRHRSKETIEKMSLARKGKPNSSSTKFKKGDKGHLGHKHSEETKAKISKTKTGLVLTAEQRKERRIWQKQKRSRVIKRLRIESLSHSFGEWENLKKQYGYICPSCKQPEPIITLTEDHIIPLSKGGSDLIENIQPLCLKCNMKKHTKIIKY